MEFRAKEQVEQVDQVIRCAYMAAFGDGDLAEDEMMALVTIRGYVNRIYEAREAIEYYESTQDLEGAEKMYAPGQVDIADTEEWLFPGHIAPFLDELAKDRHQTNSSEEVVALGHREAAKLQDPFWQKVAINICAIVSLADGELAEQEIEAIVLMFQSESIDVGEAFEWFNKVVVPVVDGLGDLDEDDEE
jgi:tellurite resistance protein